MLVGLGAQLIPASSNTFNVNSKNLESIANFPALAYSTSVVFILDTEMLITSNCGDLYKYAIYENKYSSSICKIHASDSNFLVQDLGKVYLASNIIIVADSLDSTFGNLQPDHHHIDMLHAIQ